MPSGKVDHKDSRRHRLVDADGGSRLRTADGHLLSVPAHALPHAQRALTLRAHARESRLDMRRDAVWEHERDMWTYDEEDDDGADAAADQTLSDFLPASIMSAPQSTWERGRSIVEELIGLARAPALADVTARARAEGLTMEELASVCISIVETAHGLWDAPAADAAVDTALKLLEAIGSSDSDDRPAAPEPLGVA
uniref:Uncharacterized protein n=1 Tax=Prymnesium polylepis TaxID=72548 RepID=A0A7S4M7Y2_9EUKA